MPQAGKGGIILYDGVCNLCNAGIWYVIRRDPQKLLHFCSVQTRKGEELAASVKLRQADLLRRFAFIDHDTGKVYRASTAALHVAKYLPYPEKLAYNLLVIPEGIRDFVYDAVAASRYPVFGRTDVCQRPTPDVLDRFEDRDELEKEGKASRVWK
ncbi:unnamed protein product [Vitrella brassicaformis CCMP3155]|uniref:Thiol-disulfide oxidoreductase DCC n=1 Tax=Vitrella brassicaformis (strain CCMP3155) TaxID=1169540 RepID=A0A0G4H2W5_VITBC|nr:unnamed protein product [Vitrella brassicaformis CCMP3155]|mmetsp:Transcript_41405/g.103359  ORF Transcript_41405/g.103359 Transcript_41405/m.103359 type:complete len:155 (+) Transcript_41405:89-553(+)|eukprot:CEM38019.1 unnamed protein product [Vitrella brassicaformis CCMP3155]